MNPQYQGSGEGWPPLTSPFLNLLVNGASQAASCGTGSDAPFGADRGNQVGRDSAPLAMCGPDRGRVVRLAERLLPGSALEEADWPLARPPDHPARRSLPTDRLERLRTP